MEERLVALRDSASFLAVTSAAYGAASGALAGIVTMVVSSGRGGGFLGLLLQSGTGVVLASVVGMCLGALLGAILGAVEGVAAFLYARHCAGRRLPLNDFALELAFGTGVSNAGITLWLAHKVSTDWTIALVPAFVVGSTTCAAVAVFVRAQRSDWPPAAGPGAKPLLP